MKVIDFFAALLLVLGGITWGVMGISSFNLVTWFCGTMPWCVHVIYILFGLAAIWKTIQCAAIPRRWCPK